MIDTIKRLKCIASVQRRPPMPSRGKRTVIRAFQQRTPRRTTITNNVLL